MNMWENFLDQLKGILGRKDGLFLERTLSDYLQSSQIVILDLDDVEILETLVVYVKDLPDYLRVEEFMGKEQVITLLQEELERIKASIGKREIVRSVAFFNGLGALFELYEKLSSRQESSKGPNMRIGATHSENETHSRPRPHHP